ncbi:hypothetical protein CQ020_21815 [Arthrobacter sp. MYb23]|uniref:DUF6504 family protein n=1 Tax=unclassified Arthrobacter TaxID=235627 RepID=UPI000CFC0205|nr:MULTISPECIES: DUF6504 family protein [unclassified Arthrobacter]PRB41811.1 hypothetical protein CQ038_11815 [Arthrobacter sp. MYb51]PRB90135.1 hypothetical protein CQ020_21815 [Arthrobacter sp. MYb23]
MGLFSESVSVSCTDAGQPQEVQWKGTQYTVTNEPVRWYERRQWWLEESRAPLGSGAGLVDHEIWRVQLLPSTAEPEASHSITLDLVRHLGSGRWRLLRIHDAAPASAVEPDEAA